MIAKIIDGKKLASEKKESLKNKITEFIKKYEKAPSLHVILVGDDEASQIYVRNKQKACEKVGIVSVIHKFASDLAEQDLLEFIATLNASKDVDAILCQAPLPKHINIDAVFAKIDSSKDVDGFNPYNRGLLSQGSSQGFLPCTPKGVLQLLSSINFNLEGKIVCVLGRSNIVGRPLVALLEQANATVIHCHSKTAKLSQFTSLADVVISATGRSKLIQAKDIKEGAVVIDVGISRDVEGKLHGDVVFSSVKLKASYLTPVPGGVGPMTIYNLLENTLLAAQKRAELLKNQEVLKKRNCR